MLCRYSHEYIMKKIEHLIIHCTATPPKREVTKWDIQKWHLIERGWKRLGYSDLINLKGELINLTDWNQDGIIKNHEMTWGVAGINSISMHVVYAGGVDKNNKPEDTRNSYQEYTLEAYVKFILLRYPWITVHGHNEFSSKACPSFNVQKWLRDINNIGIDRYLIDKQMA